MHTTQQENASFLRAVMIVNMIGSSSSAAANHRQQFIEVSREQRDIHAQWNDEDQRDKIFVPVPVLTRHGRVERIASSAPSCRTAAIP